LDKAEKINDEMESGGGRELDVLAHGCHGLDGLTRSFLQEALVEEKNI